MTHDTSDLDRLGAVTPSTPARLIAAVLTPGNVVAAVTLFVAIRHSSSVLAGIGWAALTLLLVVGVPYLILFRAMRTGRADDRQVVRRSQRPALMLAALACVAVALTVLALLGAPRQLIVVIVAMAGGLAALTLVTLRWKASMHMAVAAGAVAIAGIETPLGWTTALLLPLIGWARWRDGRHSVGQLIGGAVIGALAAASIYSLLT